MSGAVECDFLKIPELLPSKVYTVGPRINGPKNRPLKRGCPLFFRSLLLKSQIGQHRKIAYVVRKTVQISPLLRGSTVHASELTETRSWIVKFSVTPPRG